MGQPDYNIQPTSGLLIGLDPDYQLKQAQVDAAGAFKNGVPTDASGNPDYAAMVKSLFSKGAYEPATKLLDASLTQKQMDAANKMAGGMSNWLAPNAGGQPAASSGPASSNSAMPLFQAAIAGNESAGRYDALGPTTRSGDRAFGKYQIMGNNVGPWTKEILGTEMTPQQFIANPQAQDAVFNGKFGQYLKKYGNPQDAASMWFTGRPYAQGAEAKDQLGTSGSDYVSRFMTSLRSGDAARSIRAAAAPLPTPSSDTPQAPSDPAPSDDKPPSGSHPYGSSAPPTVAPTGGTQTSVPKGQSVSAPVVDGVPPRAAPPQDVPPPQGPMAAAGHPSPLPTAVTTPPPLSPNAGTLPQPTDPSYGGQVPEAWLNAGHSAGDWVRYARANAALASANPYSKGIGDQWSKIADNLETSIQKQNDLTNEQKNARDPTAIAYEHQRDDYKYQSRVSAQNSTTAIQGAAARKEAETEAVGLGKLPEQYAAAADGARSQNAMIDEMLAASRRFQMGKFADKEQLFNSTVSALGHKLGVDTSSIDGKVAGYEDFGKLAGQFSRQAMKESGSRAGGVQELRFITNTLPSPTMSQAGFEAVGNQLKGQNDFAIAKQRASDAWLNSHGTMRGFDTAWNSNVTPAAFVMHRLQVEQPDVFSATVNRLAQSAQGRSVLKSVRSGLSYADSNGLLD